MSRDYLRATDPIYGESPLKAMYSKLSEEDSLYRNEMRKILYGDPASPKPQGVLSVSQTVCDANVDRDGDVLDPQGVTLPKVGEPVFFDQKPIGKVTKITVNGGKIEAAIAKPTALPKAFLMNRAVAAGDVEERSMDSLPSNPDAIPGQKPETWRDRPPLL
jgi:hypothetical protein